MRTNNSRLIMDRGTPVWRPQVFNAQGIAGFVLWVCRLPMTAFFAAASEWFVKNHAAGIE